MIEPSGIERYRGSFPRSLDEPDHIGAITAPARSLVARTIPLARPGDL